MFKPLVLWIDQDGKCRLPLIVVPPTSQVRFVSSKSSLLMTYRVFVDSLTIASMSDFESGSPITDGLRDLNSIGILEKSLGGQLLKHTIRELVLTEGLSPASSPKSMTGS